MDATSRPLESPPASPDSATLPASRLTPGPAEIRADETYASTATCPDCDGARVVDDNAASVPCPTCDRQGIVCSWCGGKLHELDAVPDRAGDCRACLTTRRHRETFRDVAAYDAAYDASTWEGLARAAGDQADRFLAQLTATRRELASAVATRSTLRRELDEARALLVARGREIEDLKRQLRRRAVPMTADQIERDDGEVAA